VRRLGRERRCGWNSQTLNSTVGTAVSALLSFLKLFIFVPCFKSGWLHLKTRYQLLKRNDESAWNDDELLVLYHLAGLIISTYVMSSSLIFTSMIWKSTNACPDFDSTNAACPLSLKWSKLTYQQKLTRQTSKRITDFTTDNENSYTYTSFNGVLMVLESHHNKLFNIWVLLEGKIFDWIAGKLSSALTKS